jgi:hypothetical protein
MIWARMLPYITETVDQELLLRNGYLAAENRILKAQIKGRLLLSDGEKVTVVPFGVLGLVAQSLYWSRITDGLNEQRSGR